MSLYWRFRRDGKHPESIILNNINTIAVITNTEQKILYSNHAFRKLSNNHSSLKSALGKKAAEQLRDVMNSLGKPREHHDLTLFLPRQKSWYQLEVIKKDSDSFIISGRDVTKAKKNERDLLSKNTELENTKLAILNLLEDMTETKKSLKTANKELLQLDCVKNEFISIASHELRTPMTSIKGYLSMILEGDVGEIPKETREFVQEAFNSNEILIELVNDMLDVTRIEQGKLLLEIKSLKLSPLVQKTIGSFRIAIREGGNKLSLINETSEDLRVNADPKRLRQALRNLIDNAIKFTDNGDVTVRIKQVGNMAQISVTDTGIGMSEKGMEKLFNKFYQIKSGLARPSGGTGLGLYITKEFVEAMGGKISVRSKEGEGSTFAFTIPIHSGKKVKRP